MHNRTTPSRRSQRAPPRKKACNNCTKSKVRCDLERPACSRCRSRGQVCEYSVASVSLDASVENPSSVTNDCVPETSYGDASILGTPRLERATDVPIALPFSVTNTPWASQSRRLASTEHDKETEIDLRVVDLVPNVNAENIRDRWLRPYILPLSEGEEIPKMYHPFTLQYIARILSTYPRHMLKDGGFPPIIHRAQIAGNEMPRALANCYSLVRMWEQAVLGSEKMVMNTVENEMRRLVEEVRIFPCVLKCIRSDPCSLRIPMTLRFLRHSRHTLSTRL